jgi:hypothetical protein
MTTLPRRVPIDPLLRHMVLSNDFEWYVDQSGRLMPHDQIGYSNILTMRPTDEQIAMTFDVSRMSVFRWRTGGVPILTAIRLAEHLGLYPTQLWPDIHADVEPIDDDQCAWMVTS